MANNITINAMEQAYKSVNRFVDVPVPGTELKISVRTYLDYGERASLAERVIDTIRVEEKGFNPILFDAAFWVTFLQMATNVNMPSAKEDIDGRGRKFVDVDKVANWVSALKINEILLLPADYNELDYIAELYDFVEDMAKRKHDDYLNTDATSRVIGKLSEFFMSMPADKIQDEVVDTGDLTVSSEEEADYSDDNDEDLMSNIASAMYVRK